MTTHEFLQTLIERTKTDAVNIRAVAGEPTCDLHMFFGETVLSATVDAADWEDPQSIIDQAAEYAASVREGNSQ